MAQIRRYLRRRQKRKYWPPDGAPAEAWLLAMAPGWRSGAKHRALGYADPERLETPLVSKAVFEFLAHIRSVG